MFTFCAVATSAADTDAFAPVEALTDPSSAADTSGLAHIERQIQASEFIEVERQLGAAIDDISRDRDRFDARLVEPLTLLGKSRFAQGDFTAAADHFARAGQISRVTNGLHHPAQIEALHLEIDSLVAMRSFEEANRRHEYAYRVSSRAYGEFSPKIVPAALKLADWYADTGNILGSRALYVHARNMLSTQRQTTTDDTMLTALRGIARSYRDERFPVYYFRSSLENNELLRENTALYRDQAQRDIGAYTINTLQKGTEALIDVVRIEQHRLQQIQTALMRAQAAANPAPQADADTALEQAPTQGLEVRTAAASTQESQLQFAYEHPDISKADFITALLDLADWYLLLNKSSRAYAFYQQAYKVAVADPNTDPTALLGKPVLVYLPKPGGPKLPEGTRSSQLRRGYVEVSYDIDARGQVKRLRTLASEPRGLMEYNVRRSIAIARYRPRVVDGLPQATQAATYRHEFRYLPRAKDTPEPKSAPDAAAERPEAALDAPAPEEAADEPAISSGLGAAGEDAGSAAAVRSG
ncbi:MAG: energy transducer TonB [Pseudomonadota bacterium]